MNCISALYWPLANKLYLLKASAPVGDWTWCRGCGLQENDSPDTGRGESCLVVGFAREIAIHVVCGWQGEKVQKC